MKLCKDDKCHCRVKHWCVLCKYYDFDADDDNDIRTCIKKNVKVGGHGSCSFFECFRIKEED